MGNRLLTSLIAAAADGENEAASPKKKAKANGAKKTAIKEEVEDDNEDAEASGML